MKTHHDTARAILDALEAAGARWEAPDAEMVALLVRVLKAEGVGAVQSGPRCWVPAHDLLTPAQKESLLRMGSGLPLPGVGTPHPDATTSDEGGGA